MKQSTSNVICLLILLSNCIGYSQNTIEELLSIPYPTQLTVSPDGNSLAWLFNDKGSRNIYVAKGKNFDNVQKVTSYEGDIGIEINHITFTPDNNRLVFVRGNSTNRQNEPANPAQLQESTSRKLFVINLNGSDIREIGEGNYPKISPDGESIVFLNKGQVWTSSLTSETNTAKRLFKSRGTQGSIRLSPNGSQIAFISSRGDHSYIGIYNFNSHSIVFPDPSVDIDSDPVWSPDGKKIAFIRRPNQKNSLPFTPKRNGNPWSIRVIDTETKESSEYWNSGTGDGSVIYNSLPVVDNRIWWTDDEKIIFPWEKEGWTRLYSLDAKSKIISLLTPGDGMVENVFLSDEENTVYYTTNIKDIDRRHIWRVNSDGSNVQMITSGTGIEWSPVHTSQGLALLHSSDHRSAWPGLFREGKVQDIAVELLPDLDYSSLVKTQSIEIEATDGLKIPAILFLPKGYDQSEKHPAVIFLHGGSRRQMIKGFHYSGYYSNAFALNQYFASQGYIVMALNYRSGIGYGMDFREADEYGITGGSEVRDLIGAGEYLKGRNDVDDSKIGLWGGSYGGFLTAHGLAQRSDLFAVGVDIHGVHNWNTELPTFAPFYDPVKFPDIAKLAYESSPEYYIDGWKSPVLLIHGDDDRNVPFSESVYITELLRERNVHFEQLIFPDEVHGFLLHRNWVNAQKATFEFIDRYIGN